MIQLEITKGWPEYALLDSGDGYRLEKFGKFIICRPDPQIIWKKKQSQNMWHSADAIFQRSFHDKGTWNIQNPQMPTSWNISYEQFNFQLKLTPFKHTGIFPEQTNQWKFMEDSIYHEISKNKLVPRILNLFAYTGIASLVCARAGAIVTHVDASHPAIGWARENQQLSNLQEGHIRWILDDAIKFVQREVKRKTTYDAIIMDPPIYGHSPHGKIWKFSEHFSQLLDLCNHVLSSNPLFIIINTYATSSSALMLENIFVDYFPHLHGQLTIGELAIQEQFTNRLLSTGIFAKWNKLE